MTTQILPPPSVISNRSHAPNGYASAQSDMEKPLASPVTGADDGYRGRRRTREESLDGDDNGDSGDNSGNPGSSKKRRRSRKGMDKKFECPHEGCGKSYSRAEHLYRHQLNRMSHSLFSPNCT
jgi:hypothetical protein